MPNEDFEAQAAELTKLFDEIIQVGLKQARATNDLFARPDALAKFKSGEYQSQVWMPDDIRDMIMENPDLLQMMWKELSAYISLYMSIRYQLLMSTAPLSFPLNPAQQYTIGLHGDANDVIRRKMGLAAVPFPE